MAKAFQPGVIAAAVTPRRPGRAEIDVGAALEVIDFLGNQPLAGIALLGSTGEFVHFDLSERVRFVQLGLKRSRVPLTVNVSHSTFDGTLALAESAVGAGASALLVMPPYYFRYSATEIEHYLRHLAAQVGSPVPLFLYNIPQFAPEVPLAVAQNLLAHGVYQGIKDSSGNPEYFAALASGQASRPFELLVGNDALLAQGQYAGATGIMSGVASALPELLLAIEQAGLQGAGERRRLLQARLQEFLDWLALFPTPLGVRQALAARGVKVGPDAVRLSPVGVAQLDQFRQWCQSWIPAVLQVCAHA